jgi:hypothetical protein
MNVYGIDLTSGGIGLAVGVVTSTVATFRYLASRLSPEEIAAIRTKVVNAIKDYNDAIQDGTLSTEERLKLAEDALGIIQEIVKDLE